MIKKGDIVTLEISDYTGEGSGVGKINVQGTESLFPLFVSNTAIGDIVEAVVTKVNRSYAFASILKILEPASDRVDPVCLVTGRCGGCTFRHISYDAQLKWKESAVENTMKRIGGIESSDYELCPIIGAEDRDRYRNKAQYPVGTFIDKKTGKRHTITGFYAGRSHRIVESEDCLIEDRFNAVILKSIREYADKNHISAYNENTGEGLLRHVLIRTAYHTGEIMACLIVNAKRSDEMRYRSLYKLADQIYEMEGVVSVLLNFNNRKTNVIMGDEELILKGKSSITDHIGENKYEISARSFYQVNPLQTEKLYDKVLEYAGLTGNETVWDLYCGIGTISLFLARHAKVVYGVEIVSAAVEDAKRNAALNGIENAFFYLGKAEDVSAELPEPDVIVIDPPRKGCDEKLIETINRSDVKKLVYVSCNHATLARDAALLKEKGWKLEILQPVDMFPQTSGVECVAKFVR
ncbi:MAG: 23S rRNA (uracil(1939)-C(5))-methyltransferase RlmD [Clostridiales bacterium]|nr:23S rRNA (uracil(1939)-C(5))-methyltransferase RlmD [Clostridiales bacterium]MBS5878453.1 23S rRNA (uracil(1939)-C(5))-methyltransferase RlmD [Clostridiales bacterium]